MLAHDTGVLAATTAFGKTVVAAWLIAQRGVSTLVLVHRRQLLDQWIERLSMFLRCAVEVDRSNRRRPKPTDRAARRRHHSESRQEGRRRRSRRRLRPSDHRRVPPPVGAQLRAGCASGQSAIRHGAVRNCRTQGRPPSHHLHAVRSGAPSSETRARRRQHAPSSTSSSCSRRRSSRARGPDADKRVEFQALYQELVDDDVRTRRICD